VEDIVLNYVSMGLPFGVFEHRVQVLDLAIAFFEPLARPVPDNLFLLGPWAFDDDLVPRIIVERYGDLIIPILNHESPARKSGY
jgi:hypothetical protein